MRSHNVVAVRPDGPPRPRPLARSASQAVSSASPDDRYIFVLGPSRPLPTLDLSRTPAQGLLSPPTQRATLRFVRNHFHQFVWYFRFGSTCFVAMLFLQDGLARNVLLAAMVPAHQSLFATVLFLSRDMMGLLVHSYDFWFATIINTLNWTAFAVVLGDTRVVALVLGWSGIQTVFAVDASYRTFPTSVASMRLGVVIVFVIFGIVSLRAIDDAYFFAVKVNGHQLYDAADLMGFTSSTLAVMLLKIVVLKKRHVAPPSRGAGHLRIPCALIKVTLRLTVKTRDGRGRGSRRINLFPADPIQPLTSTLSQRVIKSRLSSRQASTQQQLRLSPLKITHIDARRTLLPFAWWARFESTAACTQHALRLVLYTIGAIGFGALVLQTVRTVLLLTSTTPLTKRTACAATYVPGNNSSVVFIASMCSTIFCSVFALLYQRDLLRLLLTNFDYLFSIAQVTAYQLCLVDMVCWDGWLGLVIASWWLWFVWVESLDALTPLTRHSLFRLPHLVAPIALAAVLLSSLAAAYVVIFTEHNGLRERTIVRLALSTTHTLAFTTKTIFLGRIATIFLWCTRQVVTLYRRHDDELHLIRGLVEYESPYALIPPKLNKQTPAISDDI